MVVACVYRKPEANIETFTESLDTVMTDLNVNNIQTEFLSEQHHRQSET